MLLANSLMFLSAQHCDQPHVHHGLPELSVLAWVRGDPIPPRPTGVLVSRHENAASQLTHRPQVRGPNLKASRGPYRGWDPQFPKEAPLEFLGTTSIGIFLPSSCVQMNVY